MFHMKHYNLALEIVSCETLPVHWKYVPRRAKVCTACCYSLPCNLHIANCIMLLRKEAYCVQVPLLPPELQLQVLHRQESL